MFQQRQTFLDRLKQTAYKKHMSSHKDIRKFSFIKRKTLNPDYQSALRKSATIRMTSPKKKIDFGGSSDSLNFKEENGGYCFKVDKKPTEKKEKKIKKKKYVSHLIEGFLDRFYSSFNDEFFSKANDAAYDILNQGFRRKVEKLKDYNDQRKEFELIITDNPNETMKKSIQQLLNTLRIENEKEVYEINHSTNSDLNEFMLTSGKKNVNEIETIKATTEELVNNIIAYFK